MDSASTSFILGYHGCDIELAERVFAGLVPLSTSHNDYDWLGDGIYFWEHNARRAFDFACEVARSPHPSGQKIKTPAVVGAIIDLGDCLNLLDSRFIESLKLAYDDLVRSSNVSGTKLAKNTGGPDLRSRKLDCAVVRMLHQMREASGQYPLSTVRAAFIEGQPLYKNAGFASKNHIQVCLRDLTCIKRYFRPLDDQGVAMTFR